MIAVFDNAVSMLGVRARTGRGLPLAELAEETMTTTHKGQRSRLKRQRAVTRARGWAIDGEKADAGVAVVAILLAWMSEPSAAISVSVPGNPSSAKRRRALIDAMSRVRGWTLAF